jgi:phosphate-selective porin OprO/OprP
MYLAKTCVYGFVVIFTLFIKSVYANENGGYDVDFDLVLIYDWHSYRGEIFDISGTDEMFDLRKLKLSLDLDVMQDLDFKLSFEHDQEENRPQTDDAYLRYKFSDELRLQVGQFKDPFGLEYIQSFGTQYTMERSISTNALTFGRNSGVKLAYLDKNWTLQAAITDDQPDEDMESDLAFTFRATTALLLPENNFIHFGYSYSQREADVTNYDIDEQLIVRPFGNLIESPKVTYSKLTANGLELAGRIGRPLLLQAEMIEHYLDDINDSDHTFSGYYLTGLWTIIGNKRDYKKGRILFDGSSTHTVELALRKSYLDLELDGDGNKASAYTAAINYYYKRNLKTSLEFQHAELKEYEGGDVESESADSVSVRMQYTY